ncbi:Heat shock 70 kDa protein 12A [Mortierella sp. AM989]|nr:Heat shock 70 kDa protein 12A [Mortierella sp. AM989]
MRRLLEEKFGYHAASFPAHIIPNLVYTFADIIAPSFDGIEDQFLQLPANKSFDELEDPEAIGIDDGYLVLSSAELKEQVFEPVVKDVLALIQEQLTQAQNCSAIFMIGGFGSSTYLHNRAKAQFYDQVGLISIPPRPELAIARGAVYVGLNPRVVTARIARRCYGISSERPFENDKDPLSKRRFEVNGVWCIDRLTPFVKKGQKLNVDECISREFSFTKSTEVPEDYIITLYASDIDGVPPRYTTDIGVVKLADIPIPCPHPPAARLGSIVKVKVIMDFRLNEIKTVADVGDKIYSTIL